MNSCNFKFLSTNPCLAQHELTEIDDTWFRCHNVFAR
jgi:hypothetical protein